MSRQLSGLLLRELVRGSADTFAAHAAAALPTAFVACHDDDDEVAATWKDVWEEGTGSPAAAVRLYIAEIASIICAGPVHHLCNACSMRKNSCTPTHASPLLRNAGPICTHDSTNASFSVPSLLCGPALK